MTAAAYTTDLATVHLAETGGGTWLPSTATGWTATGSVVNETDYFIQGVSCSSRNMKTGVGAAMTPLVGNFTVPTDGAILVWLKVDAPNCLAAEASGGIRLMLGNTQAVFKAWSLLGSNTYTYGGWVCLAANDTVAADYTLGSPTSPYQIAGAAVNMPTAVPSKGNPFGVDAIRVGRCEARFAYGDQANGYATFAGFAAVNDANTAGNYNRWGLIQGIAGGYQWQGLMTLGYTNPVDFRDSNVNVVVANTKKVTANFNKIEIRQASSRVDWTSITFQALGTVSKGRLEVVDDCDVNISACSFAGMDTFIFKGSSDVLASTFRNCGQITANAAKFNGTVFGGYEGTANTSYLIWDTNDNTSGKLDNCSFTKGTAATHAIEFGTNSPTAFTLVGTKFTGYNASNNANDSAIHIKRAAGVVTITLQSGADQPSYRTDGATVEFVTSSVNVAVKVVDINSANISGARVFLRASEGGHGFPYDATVTITNSGTTATVSHTGHGMVTNDKVLIDGASLWQNNGVFTITRTNDNEYTYTLPSAPGSNPTGTIKATFVALEGLSAADGTLSTSRSYGASQPVVGWVRKSSGSPYYKPAPLGGAVDSSNGYSATAVMISDE